MCVNKHAIMKLSTTVCCTVLVHGDPSKRPEVLVTCNPGQHAKVVGDYHGNCLVSTCVLGT